MNRRHPQRSIVSLATVLLTLSSLATARAGNTFERGDCNADGARDLSDPVALLDVLFAGGPARPCLDACDTNDDGQLDLADVVSSLSNLFLGATIPAPSSACGLDPTPDALDCSTSTGTCPELNEPPVVTTTPPPLAMSEILYRYPIAAADPDAQDALEFRLDEAPLGASIDASTGLLAWTPTAAQLGTHDFVVRVRDNGTPIASVLHAFSVEVIPRLLPDPLEEPPLLPPAAPCQCGADSCPVCDVERDPPNPLLGVALGSGEFRLAATDLRIRGRGLDVVWGRRYRSRVDVPDSALGIGWVHSYDIRATAVGPVMVVRDGNGRSDIYEPRHDGSFATRELFREGRFAEDGRFELAFADDSRWVFRHLDGTPAAGRLAEIVDRNGNTINFTYDPSGRLATIVDTVARSLTLDYDVSGRLSSITDFTGRTIQYAYYDGIAPGGAAGQLRSVTSPVVTGTPNGNDFPLGRTTTYTYAAGTGDPQLEHNLLSITSPRGDTFLVNEYGATPGMLAHDRVVRQTWGLAGEDLVVTYEPELPTVGNGQAVVLAIVNDRVGNVSEHLFDARHRRTLLREWTGRATAGVATTPTTNRPAGKLRATDPDSFTTQWQWNDDSLVTLEVRPNGNRLVRRHGADLNPSAAPRSRGVLLERERLPGSHTPAGAFASVMETFAVDAIRHLVTSHTDARGTTKLTTRDAAGNVTQVLHAQPGVIEDFEVDAHGRTTAHVYPPDASGHRRRDEFVYPPTGPASAYLTTEIVDATALALTTVHEVDAVGNRTRTTDPRGFDTLWVFNALDELVEERSAIVGPGAGHRITRDFHYDANGNRIRDRVENRGAAGNLLPMTHISTTYAYDVLDQLVSRTEGQVGGLLGGGVTTAFERDANRNVVLLRAGAATSGHQISNTVTQLHDERDLPYREIRAAGTPDASTRQFDYDGNRNLTRIQSGLEATPRVSTFVYDGLDRRVRVEDAMGNATILEYDADGHLTLERIEGELVDVPGSALNVRLAERQLTYDLLDRVVREEQSHFDARTQLPIGDGNSTTDIAYSPASQVTSITDDNGHTTWIDHDTAGRRVRVTDPATNSTEYGLDATGHVVSVTQRDRSDLDASIETFVTTYDIDGLGRMTRSTDGSGNVMEYGYDSRGNVVDRSDARRATPRGPGNLSVYHYDTLDRLIGISQIQTDDGTGAGTTTAVVVSTLDWDDSSRLVSLTDPNGHATTYTYDPLDRVVTQALGDGATSSVSYDVHDNVIAGIDPSGTQQLHAFDALDREIETFVSPAPGVCGSGMETYAYDGLSRLVAATNSSTDIHLAQDSLGNLIEERSLITGHPPERTATATYDGVGNRLSLIYPGGREVHATHDPLGRIRELTEPGNPTPLARYDYVGTRVARRSHGNATATDYAYDGAEGTTPAPGDRGFRAVRRITHRRVSDGTILEDLAFRWNAMGHKTARDDLRVGGPELSHAYDYDSLGRLVSTVVTHPISGVVRSTSYALDAVGNRTSVVGGPDAGSYTMSAAQPAPADAQVHQYTTTPAGPRAYTANGTLVSLPVSVPFPGMLTLSYDHRDQLCSAFNSSTGGMASYTYDPIGRLARRTRLGPGGSGPTLQFHFGAQLLEEQTATGALVATYLHGNDVDEVIAVTRPTGTTTCHADDQGSVLALSDATGTVVERITYGDFGAPSFFDGAGLPLPASAVGQRVLFTGRLFEPETGFYDYRTRRLDPASGRFTTRDRIGPWGDPYNLGSPTAYLSHDPMSRLDPFGMGFFKKLKKKISKALERVERTLKRAARDVSKGAADIERGVRNGAQQLERDVRHGSRQFESRTRRGLENQVNKAGRWLDREWDETVDTWSNLRRSVRDGGMFLRKLGNVIDATVQAGLRGAVQGAIFGFFSGGGPAGALAGFQAGFYRGAWSGFMGSMGAEFLGPDKQSWGLFKVVLADGPALLQTYEGLTGP